MADYIKVTEEKLSVDQITELVTSPTCGAVSIFIGTTRNNFGGRQVTGLEYEAHTPMAESELKKVCTRLRESWPEIENIAMYHRIRSVPVCEASVIIAISSPHRKQSLAAVSQAIDTLKAQVPIWKKEFYEDGESDWKENTECCWKS
ncbi:molybdopterin synthase catalytic subunit-like [Lineus longissimus]|uniref:molybdopterin synthase catalytic subunit-like n=1 Tax=Lineus longissimus TaxID=88925 RepID=UPI002B4E0D17